MRLEETSKPTLWLARRLKVDESAIVVNSCRIRLRLHITRHEIGQDPIFTRISAGYNRCPQGELDPVEATSALQPIYGAI